MRRPSPATGIALVALFISLSGTAYAATGGDFLLGKSNSANAVTSLANKKGTALSLSSNSAAPPLSVSNSVQVPNLNASELAGNAPSAFLPAGGTAVNSSDLGGTPASGFMQGGGDTTGTRLTLSNAANSNLLTSPGANLIAYCDNGGHGSGASLAISNNSGTIAGATAFWWNKDGVNESSLGGQSYVTPGTGSTALYMVMIQVDNVTSVTTFTATERYFSAATDTCHFSAQAVTTNG